MTFHSPGPLALRAATKEVRFCTVDHAPVLDQLIAEGAISGRKRGGALLAGG